MFKIKRRNHVTQVMRSGDNSVNIQAGRDIRTDKVFRIDPVLNTIWYAKPNDIIGGWCVMDIDATPGESGRYEIADFISQEVAEHIAFLHNLWLAANSVD